MKSNLIIRSFRPATMVVIVNMPTIVIAGTPGELVGHTDTSKESRSAFADRPILSGEQFSER